jgi:hypothetical protein
MTGDPADMARRMRALLPQGWFGDVAPVLSGLLTGMGTAWSCIYALIQFVAGQARLRTATGSFLDLTSIDYFGGALPRFGDEEDSAFRLRIEHELLRPRGTRAALILAIKQLTGRAPTIFEPALTSDTGGYAIGGVGYGVAGGWGNLALPFQFFVTAYRPHGSGIALLAGYGSGGIPVYADLSMEPPQIRDADIIDTVPRLLPVATIAWMWISN